MTAHVLKGSKQEILESLARLSGNVREAIVYVEDDDARTAAPPIAPSPGENMFAEMEPYMVDVPDIDDSRDAIYQRMGNE